jgi:hypothetical protein
LEEEEGSVFRWERLGSGYMKTGPPPLSSNDDLIAVNAEKQAPVFI